MREGDNDGEVDLADFVGRLVLGVAGAAAGVWAGIYIGGSASPVLLGVAGALAGGFAGGRVTGIFPRLRSGSAVKSWVAGCGMSGMFLGWFAGDFIQALAGFDRIYFDVAGAGLGLYLGIRAGLGRARRP